MMINFKKIFFALTLVLLWFSSPKAEEVTLEISGSAAQEETTPDIESKEVIGPLPEPITADITKNDNVDELLTEESLEQEIRTEVPIERITDVNDKNYTVFTGDDFYNNNSYLTSILFSLTEKDILYSALNSFKASGGFVQPIQKIDEPIQDQLAAPRDSNAADIKEFNAPSFYLKSILVPEEKKWTIWLNDLKVRDFEAKEVGGEPNLKIIKVTRTSTTLIYTDKFLDYIAPNYKDTLEKSKSEKWDFKSKDGRIKVNSQDKKVRFVIGINQTFSTAGLKISEGYVAPTTIANPAYIDTGADGNIAQYNPIENTAQPAKNLSNAERASQNLSAPSRAGSGVRPPGR